MTHIGNGTRGLLDQGYVAGFEDAHKHVLADLHFRPICRLHSETFNGVSSGGLSCKQTPTYVVRDAKAQHWVESLLGKT